MLKGTNHAKCYNFWFRSNGQSSSRISVYRSILQFISSNPGRKDIAANQKCSLANSLGVSDSLLNHAASAIGVQIRAIKKMRKFILYFWRAFFTIFCVKIS